MVWNTVSESVHTNILKKYKVCVFYCMATSCSKKIQSTLRACGARNTADTSQEVWSWWFDGVFKPSFSFSKIWLFLNCRFLLDIYVFFPYLFYLQIKRHLIECLFHLLTKSLNFTVTPARWGWLRFWSSGHRDVDGTNVWLTDGNISLKHFLNSQMTENLCCFLWTLPYLWSMCSVIMNSTLSHE